MHNYYAEKLDSHVLLEKWKLNFKHDLNVLNKNNLYNNNQTQKNIMKNYVHVAYFVVIERDTAKKVTNNCLKNQHQQKKLK